MRGRAVAVNGNAPEKAAADTLGAWRARVVAICGTLLTLSGKR